MKARNKDIISIIFPLTFFLTFFIQQKWHSSNVLDYPNLYGLFYPIFSDAIGSSFSYDYYIKGFLITIPIFGFLSYLFNHFLLQKIKTKLIKTSLVILIWIGFSCLVLPRILFITYSNFKWDYDQSSIFLTKIFFFLS